MARRPLQEVTQFIVRYYKFREKYTSETAYMLTESWWQEKHGEKRYSSYASFRVCLHHFLLKHKQRITN